MAPAAKLQNGKLTDRISEAIDSVAPVVASNLLVCSVNSKLPVPIAIVSLFCTGPNFVQAYLPFVETMDIAGVIHINFEQFEAIRRGYLRKASRKDLKIISQKYNMNQKMSHSDGTIKISRRPIRAKGEPERYTAQYYFRREIHGKDIPFPVGKNGKDGIKQAKAIMDAMDKGASPEELRIKFHPRSRVLSELEERGSDVVRDAEYGAKKIELTSKTKNIELTNAIEDYIRGKVGAGRSAGTIRQAVGLLGAFQRYISKKNETLDGKSKMFRVRDISEIHVNGFLDSVSAGSFEHNYTAVNGLFRWALKWDYMDDNPCRLIEKRAKESKEVQVLTCSECVALLEAAQNLYDGEMLAAVALMIFAGIRPDSEIRYLKWKEINLEDGEIRITKSKVKSGRMVVIGENLVEWLKTCDHSKPIYPSNFKRRMSGIRVAAGFKSGLKLSKKQKLADAKRKSWVKDYARHTAISCHLRITEDYGKTATWAGNSKDVIKENYDGLVPRRIANEFWDIFPDRSSAH